MNGKDYMKWLLEVLGEYGRDDTAEFFADAGEMYINHPDELKEANMNIYNFMNNLYQMY